MPVVNILSMVSYLFNTHGLHIPEQKVQEFWQHAIDVLPFGRDHPAAASKKAIPIGIHGDECRYTNASGNFEKLVGVSVSFPLWTPKSSRNSRFPFWVLRESLSTGRKTLDPIFRYFAWAVNCLYSGRIPETDYQGRPLPGNLQNSSTGFICNGQHVFALTELRGDWAWHIEALCLKNRWNSTSPCFRCHVKANRTEGATLAEGYLDYSSNPGWVRQQVSHVGFLNTMLKRGPICASAKNYDPPGP